MILEKNNIVKTFTEIVRVDSPTFHEEKMARDVYNRLTAMGLKPEIDKEGNVLTFLPGDSSKEPYVLNAHLDTVQDPEGPSVRPRIDPDGWIRSHGDTILGADNKTGVAAILITIERLLAEKSRSHHPLDIIFTVSEESGNHGAHGLNYQKLRAKKGYIFDASDRDFGDMIISSPAYARFDMEIVGKDAHASRPEDGLNVLPIFAKAILATKLGRIDERTRVNIGIASTGKTQGPVNTIPGKFVVSGEVRTMDDEKLKPIAEKIVKTFIEEAGKVGAKLTSKITRENGSFEFSPEDAFIRASVNVVEEMGIKPKMIKSWGCYEANIFFEHGIMMVNIADGSVDTHTTEERIRVSDLEKLGELVYNLVK